MTRENQSYRKQSATPVQAAGDKTKRKKGTADPRLLESAAAIARSGDFLANWPNGPTHTNPTTTGAVVEWFKDAFKRGPVPDESAVQTLVRWLNIAGPWDTDNVSRLTTLPTEYKKLSQAIDTILKVAPDYIDKAEARSREITGNQYVDHVSREWHETRARTLRVLIVDAKAAAAEFPVLSAGGKKKPPPWKLTAHSAASLIAAAMLQVDHEPPNFNRGPALEVLQRAMLHLEGKERALSQLREAFRKN